MASSATWETGFPSWLANRRGLAASRNPRAYYARYRWLKCAARRIEDQCFHGLFDLTTGYLWSGQHGKVGFPSSTNTEPRQRRQCSVFQIETVGYQQPNMRSPRQPFDQGLHIVQDEPEGSLSAFFSAVIIRSRQVTALTNDGKAVRTLARFSSTFRGSRSNPYLCRTTWRKPFNSTRSP